MLILAICILDGITSNLDIILNGESVVYIMYFECMSLNKGLSFNSISFFFFSLFTCQLHYDIDDISTRRSTLA